MTLSRLCSAARYMAPMYAKRSREGVIRMGKKNDGDADDKKKKGKSKGKGKGC